MTVPNLITVVRLLLVPLIVWLIASGQMAAAFAVFLLAGVSDAVDGVIARRFDQGSELGEYLDPLADKALLMSIYVCLAITGHLPVWLVILAASRDILIIGAVLLSWVMARPVAMRPRMVSKATTLMQIVLASIVLGEAALQVEVAGVRSLVTIAVALLTVVSTGAYLVDWLRHMATAPDVIPERGASE